MSLSKRAVKRTVAYPGVNISTGENFKILENTLFIFLYSVIQCAVIFRISGANINKVGTSDIAVSALQKNLFV